VANAVLDSEQRHDNARRIILVHFAKQQRTVFYRSVAAGLERRAKTQLELVFPRGCVG
jgi:hypothetical protein